MYHDISHIKVHPILKLITVFNFAPLGINLTSVHGKGYIFIKGKNGKHIYMESQKI